MALANTLQDAAQDLIASYPLPDSPSKWAKDARAMALGDLAGFGVPVKRDEYWKFTNPAALTATKAASAAISQAGEAVSFTRDDFLSLVFVDGVFRADLSDDTELEGVTIEPLALAMAQDIHWAAAQYGVRVHEGHTPVARPMAALNTAVAIEGFAIHVTGKPSKPVALNYLRADDRADAMVHHVLKMDAGSDLTLLESGSGAARFNSVMEIDMAASAAFHHVRVQGRDPERKMATHIFARLAEESRFKSFTLSVNGVLTRNEAVIDFTGDNALAIISGAAAGDGKDFHHDDTVFVTHDAVNCESRQVFKKVLRNGATGVFQGKILVQPDAQKTDGYQVSNGLLLDEDCNFLAKPELEIYADDVACSHGSTCGGLDEEALFYLVSRGVPMADAQDMLVLAFLDGAISEIEDESIADDLRVRMQDWMVKHRSAE